MDWSEGTYEITAAEIEPVARLVISRAGIQPGERVLDVACGTGNAALLAAAEGARVTGVDLAPRLLEVAAGRAEEAGLEGFWLVGDAQELPVSDHSFDLAVSIFGVIFAADSGAAARELVRAVRPGGRIMITTWVETGPISGVGRIIREAIEEIHPPPADRPPPSWWGNATWVMDLLLSTGARGVEVSEERLSFSGDSPEAWEDEQEQNHPLWLGARAVLEPAGKLDQTRARILDHLRAANEDPAAFRVTSDYLVVTATL